MLVWLKAKRQGKHKVPHPTPTPCLLPSQSLPQYLKVECSRDRQPEAPWLPGAWSPQAALVTGVASSGHKNLKAASTQPPSQASIPTGDVFYPLHVKPQHTLCRSKKNQGPEWKWVLRATAGTCTSLRAQAPQRGSRARSLQLSPLKLCLESPPSGLRAVLPACI